MTKKFERKIENFICDNCGTSVQGNGYTDHCSSCLFSKHVDINPGDRKNECKGLMEPIAAEVRKEGYRIYYKCKNCGFTHRVKNAPEDEFEVLLSLINKSVDVT